jgi:squalene cyclase
MSTKRIFASATLGVCLTLAVAAAPATANAATASAPTQPAIPQVVPAQQGATWLASQFTPEGYIPSTTTPGTSDLSSTANAILALASVGVDPSVAQNALTYMEGNVDAYVTQDGADGPGQLALLIIDAHALGVDPTSFGGTNLVSRLLATEQSSGTDTGLFGTEDQVDDYSSGVYDQGLALAALAAVGMTSGAPISEADTWLHAQQCPDGGWTSYENSDNPCNGSPADYEGPDTNSTALAVEGLSAQEDLGKTDAAKALKFITHAQDSDAGWGYEPNAKAAPGSTDPDSTALVIQAILALGKSPTESAFDHKSANPVSVLDSFQVTAGSGAGAFSYPGISGPNTLATYQAVPALAGVVFPFDLTVTTATLPSGTAGAKYSATLSASGGNPPYTWTVLSGSGTLPAGFKLQKSTGVISGKPSASGTSTFAIEVTDTKTASLPHTDNIAWKVLSITT